MTHPLRAFLLAGVAVAATTLSGCGAGVYGGTQTASAPAAPTKITAAPVQGMVMGGQQPVGGVTLQLYQAGTTGYGSAATPLGPTAQTTSGGNFNLPSYTCTAGSQVYLVGTGGQPITNVTNNNLALMVGLGTCGGADLNTFIDVNELTTVASVWALAPFMAGIANIGSSSTNAAGLANAFAAINELVTTSNGITPGPALPTGATLSTTEINSLGDILEQCINSSGGVAGDSSGCGNLFNLAPNAAGNVFPTDTITAMMNIAQNPGRNVLALNHLRSGAPVFVPAFNVNCPGTGCPPSAWTIAITYTGGGLNTPTSIAADATGAVWITNSGNASVTKLDNTGTPISGSSGFTAGGFNAPAAIAIDLSNNVWIANSGNNTITELSPTGAIGTVFSNHGLSTPESIAIDGSGNVWVANKGAASVSGLSSSGTSLTGSPFTGAGASTPVSIAVTPR